MRNNYNQLNLPTWDRSEVTNCLLLHKPHSTGNHSCAHSSTMKLHGGNRPNNRTRPHILNTILLSKLKLWANPQLNYNLGPGPTDHLTPNHSMAAVSEPNQPSPASINLISELFIVISTFSILLIGPNIIITALYSLYTLIRTQRGKQTHHVICNTSVFNSRSFCPQT